MHGRAERVRQVVAIERVEGDGTRPAVMLEVVATSDAISRATLRLSRLYWKGRSLNVQAMTR